MRERALLVMAKRPLPGRTKTRLCPPLTLEQAALLYECFLQDTLAMVRMLPDVARFIAVAPPYDQAYFGNIAPDFEVVEQQGPTLSERLDWVMTLCSRLGYGQVMAINSDSPTLPAELVRRAFDQLALENVDVVLGPSEDGGYYLIGWKAPNPRLVRQVKMSTPKVLRDTLRIAEAESLQVALNTGWYDVDDADQLRRLARELPLAPGTAQHTRRFLADMNLNFKAE